MLLPVRSCARWCRSISGLLTKRQFRRKHEGTLILYEAAAKALKEQGFQKLPDLYTLKAEYKQLAEQKDQLQRQYAEAKRQMQSMALSSRMWTVFYSRITGRRGIRLCETLLDNDTLLLAEICAIVNSLLTNTHYFYII